MRKAFSAVAAVFCVSILSVGSVRTQSSSAPLTSTAEVERRVDSILSQMTIEEKVDLLGGVDAFYVFTGRPFRWFCY